MSAEALQLAVLRSPEELEDRRADWDACVAATGGDIFFTVDWLQAWWAHFGRNRRFLALCLSQAGRTVAVLPFAVEKFGPPLLSVRIARLAGTDHNYPVLALPVAADLAPAVWSAALAALTGSEGCDAVCLSPVSDRLPGLDAVVAAAGRHGLAAVPDTAERSHSLMRLPASFDDYVDSLSSSRRREYRRSRSKIEKTYDIEYRRSTPDTILPMYAAFTDQHARQWQAVNKGGHFRDWPGSEAFYRDVLQRLSRDGRGVIETYVGNGEVLSAQLAFLYGGTAYWRLISRTLDPEASKLGVSRVAMVDRIERLIGNGVGVVELGMGEYDYKLSFGAETVPVRRILLTGGGLRARLSLGLLLNWAALLDLVYYRVWFKKLAPRWRAFTGAAPRPLWRAWARVQL